ncbi:hypothetical protein RI129_007004 [Pyrocoelia pectoralis]|uniref:DDE Tnp4 domain-containing protein n=1 Tax=Pyrocoelia pectoralis TaxID=417401 RepID=A0AAN7VH72_9COLE
MSLSNASKVFKKSLITIDAFVKTLIYWPDKDVIKKLLPIPFRVRFNNVQSIIDCFEIEIEKPSDPVKQVSDVLLLESCGFLDAIPSGCTVMADGGFKHVDKLLCQKQCKLVKPPGVSSTTATATKLEVLETKRIASLRIHFERVIRRVREFNYLNSIVSSTIT